MEGIERLQIFIRNKWIPVCATISDESVIIEVENRIDKNVSEQSDYWDDDTLGKNYNF